MTTILADANCGLMVADTHVTDGTRKWTQRKVFRIRGMLVGAAGDSRVYLRLFEALRNREPLTKEMWAGNDDTDLLILSDEGLFHCASGPDRERIKSGREAIGTGGVAAMAAYEALGWADPKRAVALAAKYDSNSGAPVRVYKLHP